MSSRSSIASGSRRRTASTITNFVPSAAFGSPARLGVARTSSRIAKAYRQDFAPIATLLAGDPERAIDLHWATRRDKLAQRWWSQYLPGRPWKGPQLLTCDDLIGRFRIGLLSSVVDYTSQKFGATDELGKDMHCSHENDD